MVKISLRDTEFAHVPDCKEACDRPSYFQFDRENMAHDIIIFTEHCLHESPNYHNPFKIAWLLEPRVINPEGYDYILNGGWKHFHYVITSHKGVIAQIPNGKWFPGGGSWLRKAEWSIYTKSRNVSMIASSKREAPGHVMRHIIIKELGNKIDWVCGRGYDSFDPRGLAFIPFRFSIVVENNNCPDYFTDKLLDCYLTGTVPIVLGMRWLNQYFNASGMYHFETIQELDTILSDIQLMGGQIYSSMTDSIKINFEMAQKFGICEDYIWKYHLEGLHV